MENFTKFKDLPKDALFSIAINLDLPDLLKFCNSSKRIDTLICKKDDIWLHKLKTEFNFSFPTSSPSKGRAKDYYRILHKYKISEVGLERAAYYGFKDLIDYYLDQEELDFNSNSLFLEAVRGNHKDIVYYILDFSGEEEKNWNTALYFAALNDNTDLMNFFIIKGANLNKGLEGAAEAGNISLINYFIKYGANDWNSAISSAARGNNQDIERIILFLINNAVNDNVPIDWKRAIFSAIRGKSENIVKIILFFIDNAVKDNVSIDWVEALSSASGVGNLLLVKFFASQEGINKSALDNALKESSRSRNARQIADYLISLGADNFRAALHAAKIYGNKEMQEYFQEKIK